MEFQYGRIARYPVDVDAVRRTEIAQTVGDEMSVVEFYGANHVRAVTIDYIGTVVDAKMSELAQVAAFFFKKNLFVVWQMFVFCSLCSAVKRNNYDVGFLSKVVDDAFRRFEIVMTESVWVVPEGAETELDAVALDNGTFGASRDSGKGNAVVAECGFGGCYACRTEVKSMVVGHAQKVNPGFLEPSAVAGGYAEGIVVLPVLFRCPPGVGKRTFQISRCRVGS